MLLPEECLASKCADFLHGRLVEVRDAHGMRFRVAHVHLHVRIVRVVHAQRVPRVAVAVDNQVGLDWSLRPGKLDVGKVQFLHILEVVYDTVILKLL